MRKVHPIPLLLVAAAWIGAGCYTVLKHPATHDLADEHGATKSCSDCHADADLYHYQLSYGGSWYSYYPAQWAFYYSTPWWYGGYWYYHHDPREPLPPRERDGRHLWSRGSGGGPGFIPPQGGTKTDPPRSSVKGDHGEQEADAPEPAERPKEKKKRTLWGR